MYEKTTNFILNTLVLAVIVGIGYGGFCFIRAANANSKQILDNRQATLKAQDAALINGTLPYVYFNTNDSELNVNEALTLMDKRGYKPMLMTGTYGTINIIFERR